MGYQVIVDLSKCIGCGLCVKDCPVGDIRLVKGLAKANNRACLYCGHCVAICPKAAIGIMGHKDLAEPVTKEKIDPNLILGHFKSRRSIRQFKNEMIEKALIEKIIEAGRYSPTGKNTQAVSFIVLDKEKERVEASAIGVLKRLLFFYQLFSKKTKGFRLDEGFLFKKAPIVLVIVSKSSVDGALAASNMALMAENQGLGVLYSGFFALACKLSKKLRQGLGLEKGEKVVTAMVLGYPGVSYQRTAPRKEAKVKWL